jgi:hypothetical protein
VVKTSIRALLSIGLLPGRKEGLNGNRNQPKSLSAVKPGKVKTGR